MRPDRVIRSQPSQAQLHTAGFIDGTLWNTLSPLVDMHPVRRTFPMKKFAMLAAAILFAVPALAADKTLTGVIGDAKCGDKHMKAEHGSQADSDHDCVTKCV